MEALILVAESRGPAILARIGGLRALNRNHDREFNPTRKDPHWAGANSTGSAMTVFFYVNTSKRPATLTTSRCLQTRLPRKRAASPREERGEGEQPASVDHLDDLLLLWVN
jgi:hypothetical protein